MQSVTLNGVRLTEPSIVHAQIAGGGTMTFGEMDPDDKHAVSHRARAFALFVEACFG